MTLHQKTTLVLGGTGKIGRRVAERLQAQGHPVRIGARSATPAFDWNDRNTWLPVLDGVGAVYISYAPDLAVPGAPAAVEAFSALAKAQGVERLVLLSGRGEEEAEAAERAVKAVDPSATVVRASWFAQNFSESFMADAIRSGEVALPVGAVGEPFIDADDIADVAVVALTEDGHAGQIYEVTGPRLLRFADALSEIGTAIGRPVRYVTVAPDEYRAQLEGVGTPPEMVGLLMYLFTTVLDGRNESVADGVQRALGRAPRDFTDYVRTTAQSDVWRVAA